MRSRRRRAPEHCAERRRIITYHHHHAACCGRRIPDRSTTARITHRANDGSRMQSEGRTLERVRIPARMRDARNRRWKSVPQSR
jgi:hypothetical protein